METTNNEIKTIGCTNGLKPLLRNQYFYGKLLTVRDFENEQSYHVKKQRLINKYIHGEGVVCGLTVEKIDDNIVKIRSGIALDCCGREIVVPEDVEKKIPTDNDTTKYWITLRYDECGEEPVAAATEANSCEEECCFSRVKEKFTIDIVKEEPETCSSVQMDNLCKLWGSLDFEKGEGSEFPPYPYPLDPGFSVNTKDMEISGHEKMHPVPNSNTLEEFVKQYQGTCPSTDKENSPLVLATVTQSLSNERKLVIDTIDNALTNGNSFDKKLVHSNPKLFELLKCGGRKEGDFAKINDINWEHDKTYQVKIVNQGIVEVGTENTLIISGEVPAQGVIKPGMHLYLAKNIEGTSFYQLGITKNYNAQNATITIEQNWSSIPVTGDTYYVINNETDEFVTKLIGHEVTFDRKMNTTTINTKTLTLSLNNFMVALNALDGEDIEIPRNTLQIPIYKKWKNEDTILQFGVPEELLPDNFTHAMGSYLRKKQVLLSAHEANPGLVEVLNWIIGMRVDIQMKGDFILSADEKVLDANHIKGTTPTGNESAGGLFESWYELEYDLNAFFIIQAYLSQVAKNFTKGFGINDIKENISGMGKSTPLILDMMAKNNLLYKENGRYFPLPDPDKTIIVYDDKHAYLKNTAEKLSEELKEKGLSVRVKKASDLTDEDKDNHEVILLRGSDLASTTSTKFNDVLSKVEWNKSAGDIEIAHNSSTNRPVFMIGGKNKAAVEKAVNEYVSRYNNPQ